MGKKNQIEIIGIFPTEEYQKCQYYANYLYKHLSNRFEVPKYRPMLDVQWTDYLTKRRRLDGLPFWKHDSPVVVFINGNFFGSEKEFTKHCNVVYRLHAFENFDLIGKERLVNVVRSSELYNDLVPLTCSNFMSLINNPERGYTKSSIHRIAKSCWIQIGAKNLKRHKNPCENYYVPHDQRGVISMCNSGKNKNNSTQFFISLQKNPWMDCYYVAFGQVVHGEDILQKIEAVETKCDSPVLPIVIEDCGEYILDKHPDKKFIREFEHYIAVDDIERMEFDHYPDDISDARDVDSSLYLDKKFYQGLYSLDYVGPPETQEQEEKSNTPVPSAPINYGLV